MVVNNGEKMLKINYYVTFERATVQMFFSIKMFWEGN